MRNSLSSTAVAIIISAVFTTGSVYAAGGTKGKTKDPSKKGSTKTGAQMDAQKAGDKVDIIHDGLKKAITGIPAAETAEFEAALNKLTGDQLKALDKLLDEDKRSILKAKIAGDELSSSAELIVESLTATTRTFDNASLMASVAARAAGREDGFTDKEAANVLKFVRAFNGASNSKIAMIDAAKALLGEGATEKEIEKKIKDILEVCKPRA